MSEKKKQPPEKVTKKITTKLAGEKSKSTAAPAPQAVEPKVGGAWVGDRFLRDRPANLPHDLVRGDPKE